MRVMKARAAGLSLFEVSPDNSPSPPIGGGLGLLSGLTSKSDKPAARAFITRMLRGDAQMLQPDKGA